MADSSGVLKIALFGGAAYLAYRYFFSTPATTPGQTQPTTVAPGGTATAPPPTATQPANPLAGWTLAKAYAALQKQTDPTALNNADSWNFFLMQAVPGLVAPDPVPVFTQLSDAATKFAQSQGVTPPPAWTRDTQMALSAYWAAMSPSIGQQTGLSGYQVRSLAGLGVLQFSRSMRGYR